ncbi:DUF4279 domain-containing protein [Burkholderia lata]|uniref:DUF4279 domain-containing protein n=1 Tax=Burkholderia lata (strain ATCC 17760 / DSM 23089 / LMG 22485 / NCIMB 9086 / R18194 / 383) TaxID=482957 RepID=UPI001581DDD4|nr:DUF4279 domain-containing protein [Burkholderia lata]
MSQKSRRAYVSFGIYQDIESPEFWTRYFGVQPTVAGAKGDPRPPGKDGVARVPPRRIGIWGIETKDIIDSDDLEPHLRYLVETLGLPRADFANEIMRTGAMVRFFCFWVNEDGNRPPKIPGDIVEMCNSQGIEIDIDEYS